MRVRNKRHDLGEEDIDCPTFQNRGIVSYELVGTKQDA